MPLQAGGKYRMTVGKSNWPICSDFSATAIVQEVMPETIMITVLNS